MSTEKPLWSPSKEFINESNLTHYLNWLKQNHNLHFNNYEELWSWSTNSIEEFWESLWNYFNIITHTSYEKVCSTENMPGCRWFEGAQVSFAEHVFRQYTNDHPALIFKKEGQEIEQHSWSDLKKQVGAIRSFLIQQGVTKGDCVVGFLPNSPEAIIAFLAVNSIGAIWSSCSPDFGVSAVLDRFQQVEPKVLFAVDGYQYGGKVFSKTEIVEKIVSEIPSLKTVVGIQYEHFTFNTDKPLVKWNEALNTEGELHFTPVEFNDPIWVLYSSGTTGIPKAITHSQGGILIEHLKYLTFHQNVKQGDRCFWYTTTGWMMWNYIQSALLCQGTVVLYDGSPAYPNVDALWQFVEEAEITHFGTSAGYVIANMNAKEKPGTTYNLSSMVSIGSTGSPLPPEAFNYIYRDIKSDVWLTSISGGTDVCSAFVGGNPLWPVYEGEIQCRALGCALHAFDENGQPLTNEMGEMVITKPMPSMPIYFWNDKEFKRYKESYFDTYPTVWKHGDWTSITERGGVIIYGRSDATLNRGGVRIGTSEIYRSVNEVEEIADSLIVCLDKSDGGHYMPLFVQMKPSTQLTDELVKKIKSTIRAAYTPRHVPDDIIEAPEIPYTISGKKTETPVKKVLMGKDISKSMNKDALKNPKAMDFFIELAKKYNLD